MTISTIYQRYEPIILSACYVATAAYIFYIGIYETMYSLGFYFALVIQALGIVIFGIAFILTNKFGKSLKVAAIAVILIQLIVLINHRVEENPYTYSMQIPAELEVYTLTA